MSAGATGTPIAVQAFLALSMLAATAAAQIPGDANCNGSVSFPADVVAVLAALFTPTDCTAADANHDGRVSAPDVHEVVRAVVTRGVTQTPTGSAGATPTPTGSASAGTMTATATAGVPSDGPEVTFIGLVNVDGCAACNVPNCLCSGTPTPTVEVDAQGRRVFETSLGAGILLVVEGKPGPSGFPIGTFVPAPIPNSQVRPDLQIIADHDLGAGSPAICDDEGVPGISPLSFEGRADITDAMIDLACHFEPLPPNSPCTLNRFGGEAVLTPGGLPSGSRQFCLVVSGFLSFPAATETVVAVRLADTNGSVGPPREIVVRVPAP